MSTTIDPEGTSIREIGPEVEMPGNGVNLDLVPDAT